MLREQSNERVAGLEAETAKANAELGRAKADIANADARAAVANAEALKAQAELTKLKTPRTISAADAAAFVEAMLQFEGTKAAIYILGEDPEPNGLGGIIAILLKRDKWDVHTWNWIGVGGTHGIVVAGKDDPVVNICDALVRAFSAMNLSSGRQQWPGAWEQVGGAMNGPNPPSPYEAPIRIVIGSKPQ